MKRFLVLTTALVVALLPLAMTTARPVVAVAEPRRLDEGVVGRGQQQQASAGERYIVRFRDDEADPRGLALELGRTQGFGVTHVYRYALSGFAARLPSQAVAALERHPRVLAVEPDLERKRTAQTKPTGVLRVGAHRNPTAKIDGIDGQDGSPQRVDVDVAVIDGLADRQHPDLNVWTIADCTNDAILRKDEHGTHVAGTIGALDNGIGVVGVAPGARIWSLKVFDNAGFGFDSYIICALDLVRRYATGQGDGLGTIEVANMSLGGPGRDGPCNSSALHLAGCRAVSAGVTVVVAAGNDGVNAARFEPAAWDEVITVSALADSDGLPGGRGPAVSGNRDDRLADFSNFGQDVDLAAPGVNILSTVPGGYKRFNGTSMASPHVAGGAALFLATHPNADPAQVKRALRDQRERYAMPNDPDIFDEGVLDVRP